MNSVFCFVAWRCTQTQKHFMLAMAQRWAAFSGNTLLVAAFSSFEIILGEFPPAEIKLFQTDVDEG